MRSSLIYGLVLSAVIGVHGSESRAIEVDLGVPQNQARSIYLDQEYLKKLQFQNNDAEKVTARMLKLKGPLTAAQLQKWLDERVSLIISEEMKLESSIVVAPGVVQYPEASVMPTLERTKLSPDSPERSEPRAKPVLVMSNTGAALYVMGKENRILLGLKKTDGSFLPLVSPHHGFIQIGAGLFLERLRVNPQFQDAGANALSRLSTLFHESRHSDGHGATLGFMHAICPAGHDYAGYPACDKNLNGPYTVGAQVLKTLAQACGDCSTKEKTVLKMIEADSRSRILRTFKDGKGKLVQASNWSDRFEQIKSFTPTRGNGLE
jgi:hypothetical protein